MADEENVAHSDSREGPERNNAGYQVPWYDERNQHDPGTRGLRGMLRSEAV